MWIKKDITGKEQVWYEAELIEKIVKRCTTLKSILNYDKGAVYVAQEILDLIQSYEGER